MTPVLPDGPLTNEAVGRLVRPYTVSDGRTRATSHFTLVTVVRATGAQTQGTFGLEHAQVLALCESPVSVAEVAARMQVPAAVVKVLLSDLAEGARWSQATRLRPPRTTTYDLIETSWKRYAMPSSNDCDPLPAEALPVGIKVLIAGGFGVGKTTFVNTLSEIEPLSTEEMLTAVSAATDRLDGVENKATTTVALDFGRITLSPSHVLYLFGTPGQERFWFMWDELSEGALGAVVLADTRRLDHSFAAVDFFERRGIPFVVAVNEFDGAHRYHAEEVRTALDLRQEVPVALCDARVQSSSIRVLLEMIQHLITTRSSHGSDTAPPLLRA